MNKLIQAIEEANAQAVLLPVYREANYRMQHIADTVVAIPVPLWERILEELARSQNQDKLSTSPQTEGLSSFQS